jgi:hypothetical protein
VGGGASTAVSPLSQSRPLTITTITRRTLVEAAVDKPTRSSKSEEAGRVYEGLGHQVQARPSLVFGKGAPRYIPELSMTSTGKARELELNDEGFEETQSLVSETLSQEASSGNYETDTHDSTRCSPAELTRTGSGARDSGPVGVGSGPGAKVGSAGTGGAGPKSLQRRDSSRIAAHDKNLARIKSFDRRDSRDSFTSRDSRDSRDSLTSRSSKGPDPSSFLPKRTASLKREPPTRSVCPSLAKFP